MKKQSSPKSKSHAKRKSNLTHPAKIEDNSKVKETPGLGHPTHPDYLSSMIGYLLRRAENAAVVCFYNFVDSNEVTPRQFAVLATLYWGGKMTQAELSARINVDRSTINEMIPRLHERGLLTRLRSQTDGRAIQIELTELGEAKFLEILPSAKKSSEAMLAALPMEYRKIFMHCLEILSDLSDKDMI